MNNTLYVYPTKSLCNKDCDFCITKKELIKDSVKEFLSVSDLDRNIDRIKEILQYRRIDEIEFTGGGEPTLNENLGNIMKFFKDKFPGLKLTLYTNGILSINDFDFVIDEINVSIDVDKLCSPEALRSLFYYRNKCSVLRFRSYINMNIDPIHYKQFFSDDVLDKIFTGEKSIDYLILGKDFQETKSLTGYISKIFDNPYSYKIKADENMKKCTSYPLIYSDGSVFENWFPILKNQDEDFVPGYHLKEIEKGQYGTLSKIYEEVDEIKDAEKQDSKLLILIELSDLVGAVKGYLDNNFKDISLEDLIKMSNITERAFKNERRN